MRVTANTTPTSSNGNHMSIYNSSAENPHYMSGQRRCMSGSLVQANQVNSNSRALAKSLIHRNLNDSPLIIEQIKRVHDGFPLSNGFKKTETRNLIVWFPSINEPETGFALFIGEPNSICRFRLPDVCFGSRNKVSVEAWASLQPMF